MRSRSSSYIVPIDNVTETNNESVSTQASTANTSTSCDKNSMEMRCNEHYLDNGNKNRNIAGNNVTDNGRINCIDNACCIQHHALCRNFMNITLQDTSVKMYALIYSGADVSVADKSAIDKYKLCGYIREPCDMLNLSTADGSSVNVDEVIRKQVNAYRRSCFNGKILFSTNFRYGFYVRYGLVN